MKNYSTKIYSATKLLPENWDEVAKSNAFLQTSYLSVLEDSAPLNMQCFFIGIFEEKELIGVALAQYLNLKDLNTFGKRDGYLKTVVRNFIFRNFATHILFLGNNMITGQNCYAFSKELDYSNVSRILMLCAETITELFKSKNISLHIVSFKDFYRPRAEELKKHEFADLYEFKTQPNMIFELPAHWNSYEDYTAAFTKKYRDQYKRARKKFEGITTRELQLEEIIRLEKRIYELYCHVAMNAPFNTFYLAEDHFSSFKKNCGNRFVFSGYFLKEQLVGFHTLLLNGKVLETYFLGYDENIQKEKMLYLNMLYNMTKFGIENRFEKIIFGRTALEIKSSIGAEPVEMSGFIYHRNKWVNKYFDRIFPKLEPVLNWKQRHPFK